MKINFRESLAATLIVSGVVFSSCVDSDKNFYDPNYRAQNPMGNISAPNGFDWLLFSSINLNVKVNDTFNGQYHYTVEVFDNNPVISPDCNGYEHVMTLISPSLLFAHLTLLSYNKNPHPFG
mgnify:FL=1